MTEEDLQRIETELSLTLPVFYKKTMLDYPLPGGNAENFGLCTCPREIIEKNTGNRNKGFFGVPWPKHLFVIGFDGCGNYYFIDLHGDDQRIYLADHETVFNPSSLDDIGEKYENMGAYVKYLEEIEAEILEDELHPIKVEEEVSQRRWWKFWR